MGYLTGEWMFSAGDVALPGPAFGRGGLSALFSAQIQALLGTPSLVIDVQHKNITDLAWTTNSSFAAITTIGVFSLDVSGLRELIRLRFTITATNDWEGVNIIIAAPAWRPN